MDTAKRITFNPGQDDYGRRIDRVLRKFLPSVPLGALYGALRKKDIRINGRKTSPEYKIRPGDDISVSGHFARKWGISGDPGGSGVAGGAAPVRSSSSGGPLPVLPHVLIETSDLLVLDKPAGLLVHGPDSLEDAVRDYLAPKLPPSLSFSPGPLHRLDRNTSGIVFFGKSIRGARVFTELLKTGRIFKQYLALLEGILETEAVWSDRMVRNEKSRISSAGEAGGDIHRGKPASLRVEPIATGRGLSLVRFTLHTGRTHQIRAQASARALPLAGDIKYGGRRSEYNRSNNPGKPPYLLHAHLVRPGDAEAARELGIESVAAEPSDYFLEILAELFGPETKEKLTAPSTGQER